MCHPMLSYCTMAIHAILQRRYKLQVDVFCKVGKTFPIWTPAHLLPPMPFIAHAIFCRQPPRPFDLYCTPHNNGCATSRWKKNHQKPQWCFVEGQQIHLGCLWLGWFRVYSRPFGWQLLQATALWDHSRTWRHPGVEGPSAVRFPQIWRTHFALEARFWNSKGEQHVISCHICYDGTIQIFTKHRAYNRCWGCCRCMSVVAGIALWMVGPKESQLEASLVMVLEAEKKKLTSMIGNAAGCFRQQILPFCPWNYPLVKQHSNVYNIPMFNRRIIFKRYMFHCYVSFQSETAKAL